MLRIKENQIEKKVRNYLEAGLYRGAEARKPSHQKIQVEKNMDNYVDIVIKMRVEVGASIIANGQDMDDEAQTAIKQEV